MRCKGFVVEGPGLCSRHMTSRILVLGGYVCGTGAALQRFCKLWPSLLLCSALALRRAAWSSSTCRFLPSSGFSSSSGSPGSPPQPFSNAAVDADQPCAFPCCRSIRALQCGSPVKAQSRWLNSWRY